jgi:hypothetical protein
LEVLGLGAPTIVDVVQKSVAKRWRLPSHTKQLPVTDALAWILEATQLTLHIKPA